MSALCQCLWLRCFIAGSLTFTVSDRGCAAGEAFVWSRNISERSSFFGLKMHMDKKRNQAEHFHWRLQTALY